MLLIGQLWKRRLVVQLFARLFIRSVLENDVKGMDDTRKETQACQQDVDEKVHVAAALDKYTERWEDDGWIG